MKKLFCMMVVLSLLSGTAALSEGIDLSGMTTEELTELQVRIREEINSRPHDYDKLIEEALEVLKAGWKTCYEEYAVPGQTYALDIRSVRVIRLKEGLGDAERKVFGDTRYVVEFLFYDDYFSNPAGCSGHQVGYMDYSCQNDCVLVDSQGGMMLTSHIFSTYRGRTYNIDLSPFVEEVTDYCDQYNQVIEFPF